MAWSNLYRIPSKKMFVSEQQIHRQIISLPVLFLSLIIDPEFLDFLSYFRPIKQYIVDIRETKKGSNI